MQIMSLLEGLSPQTRGRADVLVGGVAYRSDRVEPGLAFFCIPGFAHDGHDYAADAAARGAAAIVVERFLDDITVPQFRVTDTRVALAVASAAFWGHPSRDVAVVGVTGTNGKTTTTYLLDSILRVEGRATGIVGTIETRIAGERREASRTTPESSDLEELLAQMLDAGVWAVSVEVSSHAIDLHRVDGVDFAVAAFTNLTQDHLDYHHTLEEYFSVKRRFFTDFTVGTRVIDIDDPLGAEMASALPGVLTVGRAHNADLRATDETLSTEGSNFTLVLARERVQVPIRLPLAGAYNVSNALVAAGCALALGVPISSVAEGLDNAPQVPGRLEKIDGARGFAVIVDYAHTPDSLAKAIRAVRAVTEGRVIAVFGCGGDRDPEKRPLMGAAAGAAADHSIVTSDNPRSEDPVGIILQIEDGLRESGGQYEVEVDRRLAIERAISIAQPGDCVLIAGKGHESYQIFADRTVHFDDREVAREILGQSC